MNDLIQIFVTGGTFDKEYNFITGDLYFRDTHLRDMFERGRSTVRVDITTLMMKDSLYMSDLDRDLIVHACRDTPSPRIVITHGTDTMVNTSKILGAADIPKTIVITGAMIPYAFGNSSDGFFNIGASLAFAQSLPNGVYISMNGRCFDGDRVRKNIKTGFFEDLE